LSIENAAALPPLRREEVIMDEKNRNYGSVFIAGCAGMFLTMFLLLVVAGVGVLVFAVTGEIVGNYIGAPTGDVGITIALFFAFAPLVVAAIIGIATAIRWVRAETTQKYETRISRLSQKNEKNVSTDPLEATAATNPSMNQKTAIAESHADMESKNGVPISLLAFLSALVLIPLLTCLLLMLYGVLDHLGYHEASQWALIALGVFTALWIAAAMVIMIIDYGHSFLQDIDDVLQNGVTLYRRRDKGE